MTVIYIDKNGDIQGLADDFIDKLDLGTKQVARVSDIEWNHSTNLWEAKDSVTGEIIASNSVRGNVINAERAHLNKKIEHTFAQR
jgi:hypothetical protein